MPLTGTVDAANARIDLFVDYTTELGTQTFATMIRHTGSLTAPGEYVRGLFGTTLLGEQAYVSDHEAPLDAQVWYTVISGPDNVQLTAGPFTIPSNGYVWMKDPGRPWADLRLDLCVSPDDGKDPCLPTAVVTDTFTRSVTDGWGSTDTGHAWQTAPGANADDFDVDGVRGIIAIDTVNSTRRTYLPASFVPGDVDVTVTAAPDVIAAGGNIETSIMVRVDPGDIGNTYYYFEVEYNFAASHTVRARIVRRQAGVDTPLTTAIDLPGLTYTAGQKFHIRAQAIGALLRMRVWPDGIAEGTDWDVSVSDTALTSGRVGLRATLDPGNTNTLPVLTYWDDLAVTELPVPVPDDVAWVGFRDKVREADAGLFPVLDRERPADVYARRKDITTGAMFLTRSRGAIDLVYELYTAGGPLMFQVPAVYHMNAPTIQRDRYYQPDALNEGYISQDQRRPIRLWTVPLTAVDFPVGEPQGTDTANWCALMETYGTYADFTATGYNWGQVAAGDAVVVPTSGLYGGGTYGGGFYGG